MLLQRNTFSKEERLCSRKAIEELFSTGTSVFVHPIQIIWKTRDRETKFPAQVAVAVAKKTFRLAVTRNLIKRRMREAYRKNKFILYEPLLEKGLGADLMIIYKEKNLLDYGVIEQAVAAALKKVALKATKPGSDS